MKYGLRNSLTKVSMAKQVFFQEGFVLFETKK